MASLFLLGVASVYVIFFYPINKNRIYYKDFGIYIPSGYNIHGIDVSHYQRGINWELVKAMKKKNIQIRFAFIKATESNYKVDAYFFRNWKGSKENGIIRGAYHYFDASNDAKQQAILFSQVVNLKKGDLPPVIDVEKTYGVSNEQLCKKLKTFIKYTEQHFGISPIIYTYSDFYKDHLEGNFDNYPLWIAHYTANKNPRVKRQWHFWQHHETGRVNGIKGPVDFNVFNGDTASFENLLIN
jgi:lysozyme